MRILILILLAVVCGFPVLGDDDIVLPWGGPFINESDFPADGDPSEYYWVELALVGGNGPVTLKGRGPGPIKLVSFYAMEGEVNRVLLYGGKDMFRTYTIDSWQMVRILYVPCGDVKLSRDNRFWGTQSRIWEYIPESKETQMANLDLIRRETPVPAYMWVSPDLDIGKSEATLQRLRDEKSRKDMEDFRKEHKRKRELEEAKWKANDRARREKAQLEMVDKAKVELEAGNADSGLVVSYYCAAYSKKLSKNGRNAEAARVAAEAFKWLRKAAEAGSPRACESLGWHLLNGGGGVYRNGFVWSGPAPDVPRDNAYVSPAAFQGTDVPADVLLSETNGIRTYYRVYSRDPVEGVRMMKLAKDRGDPRAARWFVDHESNKCDLAMPTWFLAKDGFSVAGKTAVSFDEVTVRRLVNSPVKRKIGKDAEGNVVSISDEYFQFPGSGARYGSPWHEASDGCVITEVLP